MNMLIPLGLGLAGSLHCIGMCGPIFLAVMPDGHTRRIIAIQALLYHIGRILTYAILGALFGIVGKGMQWAGIQQILTIVLGFLFIGVAFFAINLDQKIPVFPLFNQRVKTWMNQLMRSPNNLALVGLGLLNGLLPCGLVYAAIAGAITTANGLEGIWFMALFGLGTLPLLFLFTIAGKSIKPVWKQYLRKAQPVLFFIVGLLCIFRGVRLDVSLFESVVPIAPVLCH